MMMADSNEQTLNAVEETVEETQETETPETQETETQETVEETKEDGQDGNEEEDGDKEKEGEEEEEPKSKRGRPKKEKWGDNTKLEYDKDIHEDYHVNEEYQQKFVEFAKENNIEPSTAKELLNLQARLNQQFDEEQTQLEQKEMKQTEEALRKEWGPEYDNNMKAIQKLVKDRADEDVANLLFNTSFGTNQSVIKMLGSIAKDLNESGDFVKGKAIGNNGFPDAYSELQNEYKKDPEFQVALRDTAHPKHNHYNTLYNEITMRHTQNQHKS